MPRGLDPSSNTCCDRNYPKIKTRHGASCVVRRHMQSSKANSTSAAYQASCNGASHSKMDEDSFGRYMKELAGTMQAVEHLSLRPSVLDSTGQQLHKTQEIWS